MGPRFEVPKDNVSKMGVYFQYILFSNKGGSIIVRC